MPEVVYQNNGEMSIPVNPVSTEDTTKETTDLDFMFHAFRVLPAIVHSLELNGMDVLTIWIECIGPREVRVHVLSTQLPKLVEWATQRAIQPEIQPHGEGHQVVYMVDGIKVFTLLDDRDMERYFPV